MKKLICGDALEELKKLDSDSIDVGVTSPPYNKKGVRGTIVPNVVYDSSSDDLPEEYYQDMQGCLLYTSPSPRDRQKSRMPSSA